MDFDFSDDQNQLRDAVRRYVDKAYTFDRRRAIEKAGGYSAEAYAELADLGLTGLCVSEAYGGMGMGPVEALVVMEEMGRGIVLEPLMQSLVCAPVLDAFAPDAIKTDWLPPIASGKALVVLAHQERGNRYQLAQSKTQGVQSANAWRVSGAKTAVPAADSAQAFLVPAMVDGALALFLVKNGAAEVAVEAHSNQDGSRAGHLTLSNAEAQLVTTDGLAALELAADIAVVALCAEGVGAMEKTMQITAEYMNTRKQFGVVISTFQALRHRLADMKMALELARSMGYYAALRLGAPAPDRRQAMARAKVQLGNSMRAVGQGAVQLHGGIGVTDEYIVSHYFKRLTVMEMSFGDTMHHLGEVSKRMQADAGVFA